MKVRRFQHAPPSRCGNLAAEVGIVAGSSGGNLADVGPCGGSAWVWVEVPGGHIPLCQRCWAQLICQQPATDDARTEAAMSIGINQELEFAGVEFPAGKWNTVSDRSVIVGNDEEDDEDDDDFEDDEDDDDSAIEEEDDDADDDDSDWEEVGDDDDDDDEDEDDWDDDEDDDDGIADDEEWLEDDGGTDMFEVFTGTMFGVFELDMTPSIPLPIALLKTFELAEHFLAAWLQQNTVPSGAEFVIVPVLVDGKVQPPDWDSAKDCRRVSKR